MGLWTSQVPLLYFTFISKMTVLLEVMLCVSMGEKGVCMWASVALYWDEVR